MNEQYDKELKAFGENLKALRLKKGISQEKFAELTGLDRTYISGLERGVRNPSFLILKRLAAALAVQPSELF